MKSSIIKTHIEQLSKRLSSPNPPDHLLPQIKHLFQEIANEKDPSQIVPDLNALTSQYSLDQIFKTDIIFALLSNRINAHSQQIMLDLEELENTLNRTKNCIKKFLNFRKGKFFAVQSPDMKNKKQYLGRRSYQRLKFFSFYIETLLQQAVTLSQLGRHKEALEKTSECFTKLKVAAFGPSDCFRLIKPTISVPRI